LLTYYKKYRSLILKSDCFPETCFCDECLMKRLLLQIKIILDTREHVK
jgi:hypothetical protein